MRGDIDIIRELIKYKADVNKQDISANLIDWVLFFDFFMIFYFILFIKFHSSNLFYYSPLHYCSNIGFIDGARALLDAGAFINLQSRLQETPLIMALQEKQSEMVDFLIQSRADVDKAGLHISITILLSYLILSYVYRTPLFFASEEETAELLISHGASVTVTDDGGLTPLHIAARNGYLEVAKLLIDHGADVNATDNQKQTPLHAAAEDGQEEMCELLLKNGAELKVLDSARRSPEMLARRNEHYGVLQIITKFHASEDDDAPLLAFKPFAGVIHSADPPKDSTDPELQANEFKFDISPE